METASCITYNYSQIRLQQTVCDRPFSFVITGLICVLKWQIGPKNLIVITECSLGQSLTVQVSLAIRGGYVPEKFHTANTKTDILGLI